MRRGTVLCLAFAAAFALGACGKKKTSTPPPQRYTIGGTVVGLSGTGLVLQNNGGDDLAVGAGATTFKFATSVASGGAYAVTVKTQPTNPAETCTVANGAGNASANVSSVVINCAAPDQTFTIGGAITGLTASGLVLHDNLGEDLTVSSGATSYVFAGKAAAGTNYEVTVKTQPTGLVCTVAHATGAVGSANVTDVDVSCAVPTFAIGGAVSGLTASGLVLHESAGEDLPVSSGATSYVFAGKVPAGSTYEVTVKTQPAGLTCTVAHATGTVGNADVTNADVSCTNAVQRWAAPTSWGGLWPASSTMVQHAHFDGTNIVEDASTGIAWSVLTGSAPPQTEFKGFPSGSRFGAGPFTGQRYETTGTSDAALDALTGDMLVCAVVKPDFNPTMMSGDDHEKPIIARGVGHTTNSVPGGGWVLMQMHSFFCFHYEYVDGTGSHLQMAIVPTYFADHGMPGEGPLNPSYVVFCAGRSGNTIRAAVNAVREGVNAYSDATVNLGAGPIALDNSVLHRTTIGGYDDTATDRLNHVFGGKVYETAVWNEPATPANIQAKLDAIQGIVEGGKYLRNREAWFTGADGALHATYWDGPRIEQTKGFLFGLQGWNHLGYSQPGTIVDDVFAPGEDMGLWTPQGGATVAATGTVEPPGDSGVSSAKLVTLPPGGSLQTPLAAFDSDGAIHGQIWLRVPAATTGTLQLVNDAPATGGSGTFDVDLSSLAPDTWTRIWLKRGGGGNGNELTTSGSAGHLSLLAPGTNPGNVELYAWGVDLTQIGTLAAAVGGGGGVDLGAFDPGQAMYDWAAFKTTIPGNAWTIDPLDVLQLPPVPASTPGGFCLTVDASTPAGLPWSAPFTKPRTAVAWVSDPLTAPPSASARIYVDGARDSDSTPNPGQLCFAVTGTVPLCVNVPASFTPGSAHTIRACMSAAGNMALYADGSTTPLTAASRGVAPPDLAGGSVLVGSALTVAGFDSNPWHGYVSKVVVCQFGDTCE